MNLDIAGRELCVVRPFTLDNLAFDGDDKLAAQVLRLRMCVARVFFAHNNLRHAVAVAQIDKRKNAKIALLRDPAHQHDLLADIRLRAAHRKCVSALNFQVHPT